MAGGVAVTDGVGEASPVDAAPVDNVSFAYGGVTVTVWLTVVSIAEWSSPCGNDVCPGDGGVTDVCEFGMSLTCDLCPEVNCVRDCGGVAYSAELCLVSMYLVTVMDPSGNEVGPEPSFAGCSMASGTVDACGGPLSDGGVTDVMSEG